MTDSSEEGIETRVLKAQCLVCGMEWDGVSSGMGKTPCVFLARAGVGENLGGSTIVRRRYELAEVLKCPSIKEGDAKKAESLFAEPRAPFRRTG